MFKSNIISSLVILVLLAGNIYLSIQYVSVSKQLQQVKNQTSDTSSIRSQASLVLKEFLNVVLDTQGTTSSDDRIKLESDLRQLQDPTITSTWTDFLGSKNAKTSQVNAVKLIGLLENKMF